MCSRRAGRHRSSPGDVLRAWRRKRCPLRDGLPNENAPCAFPVLAGGRGRNPAQIYSTSDFGHALEKTRDFVHVLLRKGVVRPAARTVGGMNLFTDEELSKAKAFIDARQNVA